MSSHPALLSVDQAQKLLQTLSAQSTHARQLTHPVMAGEDGPHFDRVTMDGIAVESSALQSGQREFKIAGLVAAGQPTMACPQGWAIEVMTGAVLPPNSDCVIPYELITLDQNIAHVHPSFVATAGHAIIKKGSYYRQGEHLIPAGTPLTAPVIGALASLGQDPTPWLPRRPRIAILATGSELVPAQTSSSDLAPHQLRLSNPYALTALLTPFAREPIVHACIPDEATQLETTLGQLMATHEIIITIGAVSAGKFDFVPAIFARLGLTPLFHKIAQRPGKPMLVATGVNTTFFALPGNPLSALTCCRRYLIPFLTGTFAPTAWVEAPAATTAALKDLTLFAPVRVSAGPHLVAELLTWHGSGDYSSLVGSSGLIEIPPSAPGPAYAYYAWHSPLPF